MFIRSCPKCDKDICYKSEVTRNRATKRGSLCQSCANREISNRSDVKEKTRTRMRDFMSDQSNRDRISQSMKKYYSSDDNRRRISERQSRRTGHLNSFYGKRHSEESKRKMVGNKDYGYTQTKEFKDKCRKVGMSNGMYGRSVYDVWVERYGEDRADQLMMGYKEKLSLKMSGENNPMYGKPSPIGSGCGWSGWYDGFYFRSLLELSYIINVLEKCGYSYRSAESSELSIPYMDDKGNNRTYKADFFVDDRMLIEVKPDELKNIKINRIKFDAACKFCVENGFEFIVDNTDIISYDMLKDLYDTNKLFFVKKWEDRFKTIDPKSCMC